MGLKITTAAGDRPVVYLYGVIGESFGGITASDFREALDSIPTTEEIDLRIHSEGGSYTEAIAMHSNLTRRKAPVRVTVDGLAASGGSIVAMAGETIEMAEGSWMMMHEANGKMSGGEKDFREAADRLASTNGLMADIYSKRWNGVAGDLRSALAAETWMTASKAIEYGMADSVSSSMALAAKADMEQFAYTHIPDEVIASRRDGFPLLEGLEERMAAVLDAGAAAT